MQIIQQPLTLSQEENERRLRESEGRAERFGDPDGNRHERRVAARNARRERRVAL